MYLAVRPARKVSWIPCLKTSEPAHAGFFFYGHKITPHGSPCGFKIQKCQNWNDPWLLHFAIFVFLYKLRSSTIKGHFWTILVSNIILCTSLFYGFDSASSSDPSTFFSLLLWSLMTIYLGGSFLEGLCLRKLFVCFGIFPLFLEVFLAAFCLHYNAQFPILQARILHKLICVYFM